MVIPIFELELLTPFPWKILKDFIYAYFLLNLLIYKKYYFFIPAM